MKRWIANLKGRRGQFLPISAMVAFTTVVSLVAVVNMYKMARAKIQAQALADGIALAIATQEARLMNLITDRNEWLNHLYVAKGASNRHLGVYEKSDVAPQWVWLFGNIKKRREDTGIVGNFPDPEGRPVGDAEEGAAKKDTSLAQPPPLSFVENTFPKNQGAGGGWVFNSEEGAKAYAELVATINDAQRGFETFYNGVIGADPKAKTSFNELLREEIPALKADPSIVSVHVYNTDAGEQTATRNATSNANSSGSVDLNADNMQPIKYEPHDIAAKYFEDVGFPIFPITKCCRAMEAQFSRLSLKKNSKGLPVGWMVLGGEHRRFGIPTLKAPDRNNRQPEHIGAGVILKKRVSLGILGTHDIMVKSKAVVVIGSGVNPGDDPRDPNHTRTYEPVDAEGKMKYAPIFIPTYWVKLVPPR